MADYCECGSLIINNSCTNAKCKFSSPKKKPVKKASAAKIYKRKASNVLTYGIKDLKKKYSP